MCRARVDADIRSRHTYHHVNTNLEPKQTWRLKSAHKSFIMWHILGIAYYLSSSFCQCMQNEQSFTLEDLSHTFDNETIYWVTEPRFKLNVTYNGTSTGKGYWYQKDEISGATHGGTHIDAPCHFAKGRWCVSDIPLERLVVPAIVIDISKEVGENPNVHLTMDHLMDWEKKFGQIPRGSLVLVHTGWSRFWPDPLKYTGTGDRKIEELKFPSIDGKVAEWIISNREIVGVGIDTMSVDVPNSESLTTHVTLMEQNIYGLENVNNLHLLPPTGTMAYVMPMKIEGASGAPCRIVAQIPIVMPNAAALCNLFCSNLSYIITVVLCIALFV